MPFTPPPKDLAEAIHYVDLAIKAHARTQTEAKKADPGYEESDFNRGYGACLIDIQSIFTKGHP